jgi:hypothetical protein
LGISKNQRSRFGNFDLLLLLAAAWIPDEISPGETVEPISRHGWETGGLHSGRRSRAPTSYDDSNFPHFFFNSFVEKIKF